LLADFTTEISDKKLLIYLKKTLLIWKINLDDYHELNSSGYSEKSTFLMV